MVSSLTPKAIAIAPAKHGQAREVTGSPRSSRLRNAAIMYWSALSRRAESFPRIRRQRSPTIDQYPPAACRRTPSARTKSSRRAGNTWTACTNSSGSDRTYTDTRNCRTAGTFPLAIASTFAARVSAIFTRSSRSPNDGALFHLSVLRLRIVIGSTPRLHAFRPSSPPSPPRLARGHRVPGCPPHGCTCPP